jgi:lipopolysaccharide transport system ATP-binding protein
MEEVAGEGRTVLFVSHNMSAINRLCPRTMLLSGGQVQMDDETAKVTGAYFQSTGGSKGELRWSGDSAPGTEELRLNSVTLRGPSDSSVSVTDVTQPLFLKFSYSVLKPSLRFRCTAAFFTQGVCAFTSIEPEERTREMPGDYHSTLVVPRNLLAEGEYTISFSIISTMGAKHYFVEGRDTLMFRVVDGMSGESARGDYTRGLGGVLRPILSWESAMETVKVELPV